MIRGMHEIGTEMKRLREEAGLPGDAVFSLPGTRARVVVLPGADTTLDWLRKLHAGCQVGAWQASQASDALAALLAVHWALDVAIGRVLP